MSGKFAKKRSVLGRISLLSERRSEGLERGFT